jgi:hypothetical protein
MPTLVDTEGPQAERLCCRPWHGFADEHPRRVPDGSPLRTSTVGRAAGTIEGVEAPGPTSGVGDGVTSSFSDLRDELDRRLDAARRLLSFEQRRLLGVPDNAAQGPRRRDDARLQVLQPDPSEVRGTDEATPASLEILQGRTDAMGSLWRPPAPGIPVPPVQLPAQPVFWRAAEGDQDAGGDDRSSRRA